MDSFSPPPSISHRSDPRTRTKSASRMARTNDLEHPPSLCLDLVSYSPNNTLSPNPVSLHDLLLLSPSPGAKRLKPRLDMADDALEPYGSRRRCKNRNGNVGSPRNSRRSRRRIIEQEVREDKDSINADDMVKAKKRRNSGRSKKEKSISCTSVPSPKGDEDNHGYSFDRIGLLINDLIMWNDVAKSTLWFGFGSLCFLSSCFTTDVSFSMFSVISQLGLLILGVSFFSNSIAQRNSNQNKREVKLKEDDVLRAARIVLPAANFVISKTWELFSGEPSMTLKVAPFLLVGAEYGHLITLKRLCALGFFIGFTGPKLYSVYSVQINKKGEYLNRWVVEAWGACSHKKVVAASALTAFWNLTSLRTRIFAAFMCLVLLRYHRQHLRSNVEETEEQEQQQVNNKKRS